MKKRYIIYLCLIVMLLVTVGAFNLPQPVLPVIQLPGDLSTARMLQLRDILIEHSGDIPVRMVIPVEGQEVSISPEQRFRVHLDKALVEAVEKVLGHGAVQKLYGGPPAAVA